MTADVALVWARRDLRLADNPALSAACAKHDAAIVVLCHDPASSDIGAASKVRLHHSLKYFQQSIETTNLSLILSPAAPTRALAEIAAAAGASAVYWNRLYEPQSIAEEEAVRASLDVPCHRYKGHLLIEPEDHLKADGTPYRVFTPFWKALAPKLDGGAAPLPTADCKQRAAIPDGLGCTLDRLNLLPSHSWAAEISANFEAGEAAAQNQAGCFVDETLADYKKGRDQLDNVKVSGLSPFLHFGEISPRQVLHMVEGQAGAEAFVRQLAWRDFAHHLLFHFPDTVSEPLNPKFAAFPWQKNEPFLEAWKYGRTGISLVDAGMQELWQTGTMHNRVRMVAASLLVKNMQVDWRDGMAWFWDTLIDADLANNVMGWQWVAGCGADAAPYFRVFNPQLQAEKFDADGAYRARWLGKDWDKRDIAPVVDLRASRQTALQAYDQIK